MTIARTQQLLVFGAALILGGGLVVSWAAPSRNAYVAIGGIVVLVGFAVLYFAATNGGSDPIREIRRELRRLASSQDPIRVTGRSTSGPGIPSSPGTGWVHLWVESEMDGRKRYRFDLSGGGISTADPEDILVKLRSLPSRCGYHAVWDELLYMSEGPDRDD